MANQNIIILGLQGTGSTYLITSMWEILHNNNYYDGEILAKEVLAAEIVSEEIHYNNYKNLFNYKSNWYINLQLPIEYQQFVKAFEFNESVEKIWTILLIRKDFLDVYLTFLIRWHTKSLHGRWMWDGHMRSNSKKEIVNWKEELILSKEIVHTNEILDRWKNDVIAFFITLKNWPLPINNIVIYESLLGDYSLQDRRLILKGLNMKNKDKMQNAHDTDVVKMWQNREEKLNTIYNLDKLYNDFESVRNQFKLDENYQFDLETYNSS